MTKKLIEIDPDKHYAVIVSMPYERWESDEEAVENGIKAQLLEAGLPEDKLSIVVLPADTKLENIKIFNG